MKNREWRAFKIDEVFEVVDGFYNKMKRQHFSVQNL